jgi:methionyl-tRNA synthetase
VIPSTKHTTFETKLIADVNALLKDYVEALETVKIRQGLRIFMEISARGNLYLQENKIDNALFANNRERCDTVVHTAINLAYLLSALVYPYIPTTALAITDQLCAPPRKISEKWSATDILAGHTIGKAAYLFKRIEEDRVEELRAKYSGQNGPAPPAKQPTKGAKNAPKVVKASTPEQQAVEDKIKAQGDVVRKLKAEKASAGDIKVQVDMLLLLKKELESLSK